MGDRLAMAIDRAREVLDLFGRAEVHKGIWGSPMGKSRIADRIVAEIPEHRVYVEPFAGGAQVLFAKEPSEVEVVSDLDPDIAFAFEFAKRITPEQLERLRRKKWVGDKEHFRKLVDAGVPEDELERFYRFAYLSRFSFNKLRRGTMPDKNVGARSRFVERIERHAPRLKKVRVRCADYEKVVDEFDGPDTFFFLDPPYAGYDADTRVGAGHKDWDEERFAKVLRRIEGRFLCTYGTRGSDDLFDGFVVRRWRHTSGVGTSQGNGPRQGVTLVATNYDPQAVDRRLQAAGRKAGKASGFQPADSSLTKTIWGSPAGKKRLADRLAGLLPAHKTYVEPFAGSAAVLFAKEPAAVEVINDADPEIVEAYRIIKRLTRKQLERLQRLPWTGDEATFKRLFDASPTDDVGWLHRFLYLTHFSYGKMRGKSFSPSTQGIEARTAERLEAFAPRLKNVRIYGGDYEKVVRKYDAPDTVFYLDPPYAGYNVDIGEGEFDEERFLGVLKSLEGKFLLTYGVRGKLPALLAKAGFHVKRIRTPRSIGSMRGVGGPSLLTQLVVSNYALTEKADADGEPLLEDWNGQLELDDRTADPLVASGNEVEKAQAFGTFGGSHHYAKRIVPLIPEHTTYVEPFAGAAAVLYAKEPSSKEVIADLDDDVVFLHRSIKSMTAETIEKLRRFEWTCTEQSFAKARDMEPKDDLARFYKLVFVRTHARDCRPDGTHPARNHLGSTTNPEKYLRAAERLKNVTILKQDYRKTVERYDGPGTFFFLDPPYPGEWYDKDAAVDVDEFVEVLAKIKGRFIAVLNDSPENAAAFKRLGHVFRLKVREASGTGGAKTASRLFCANFKVAKADGIDVLDDAELAEAEKAAWSRAFINDLPDSAFLYIEPGGEKDEDGRTVPRNLRHFPVRGADGKLDLPHLRNAIARIPQAKIPGLTPDELRALQDRARELLAEATEKNDVFAKSIPLIKGVDPGDERYVLGVVLEPEVVDAQGDIYSTDEVRQAAHRFMEEFGGLGLMHRFRVNDQVKVLESYLAPVDFAVGETNVRKGTWLLAVRILSDELWEQVKDGKLTGFSIGGSARRVPEEARDRRPEAGGSIRKAAPSASSLQPHASINRLLDIVVEEVSLVDRAANKHRFLIVKRSDDMDENHADEAKTPDGEAADTAKETPPENDAGDTAGKADGTTGDSVMLEAAVEALERLTDTVEMLGALAPGDARLKIGELASELRALADRLAASAGSEAAPPPVPDTGLAGLIGSVRASLQQVASLIDAGKAAKAKPAPEATGDEKKDKSEKRDPVLRDASASPLQDDPLRKDISGLADSVRKLALALKEQAQRLSKLEKRFGLPNSAPAREEGNRPEDEDVGWPMDLNRPFDRENVDKAVSFHDL